MPASRVSDNPETKRRLDSLGHILESTEPGPSNDHTSSFTSEPFDRSLHELLGLSSSAGLIREIMACKFGKPEWFVVLCVKVLMRSGLRSRRKSVTYFGVLNQLGSILTVVVVGDKIVFTPSSSITACDPFLLDQISSILMKQRSLTSNQAP